MWQKEDVVRNKETGNLYKVVALAVTKRNFLCFSWWVSSVVYESISKPSTIKYVRSLKDFNKNFTKV